MTLQIAPPACTYDESGSGMPAEPVVQAQDAGVVPDRDEWIALVTHDLRAPLNTILLATELLGDETLNREQRLHWLSAIRAAAERMNALVGDLLQTARLESCSAVLAPERCRLRPLLLEVLYGHEAVAERAGIDLSISECEPDLEGIVDAAAIVRALGNLVENAIRFTPDGGRILLAARPACSEVGLTVCDSGVGILPEHLPHIFDRFWQAAHTRRGGAGLGLTIVREIAKQHGGRISVRSEPGRGTCFQLLVPAPLDRHG